MLDLAAELAAWTAEGREFAVATVVAVRGSAPRGPGAALAVDSGGTVVGSVSGGCVEGAVYELCAEALGSDGEGPALGDDAMGESGSGRGGQRPVLAHFGYDDEDAFAVGLSCGGELDVLVVRVPSAGPERELLCTAFELARSARGVALARVVEGPAELVGRALLVGADGSVRGGFGGPAALDATAVAEARALLDTGRTGTVRIGAEGSRCGQPVTVLVESSVPPPRLVVFGAVDFAAELVRAGKFLGFHVTVCDARPVFATPARFPEADEVVAEWPDTYLARTETDARTALCVLTHDAKFDVPLLDIALRLPVAYVGAMGSRRTHLDRLARLRAAGLGEDELAKLHSPIGLDLGARTPQETALSIAAEIVAARRGGSGVPLTGGHRPIHADPAASSAGPAE
ncbi:XdhC family protein [Streptomyces sp. NA04227]|uniref:XdhC family protein n=1 Tax=Streptomyces sp. NA04227 TaxID=2742136 RepID=UPI00159253F5|nr:XdhC/CoxI family protein [Streptomyces sp. NA04227]QKW10029.1 XdhC family protein [Streptomyces sp. NA04227]